MNVAIVTRYVNSRNGGLGVYSQELVKRLIGKHQIDLLNTTRKMEGKRYLWFTLVSTKLRMPRGCDVYHALSPWEGLWIPKNRGVTTFHDLMPWLHRDTVFQNQGLKKFIGEKHFKLCAKTASRSKHVICNSRDTRDKVVNHLDVPREKTSVIRLGVSSDLGGEAGDSSRYVSSDRYSFGTLCRHSDSKRIHLAIQAFKDADLENCELILPSTGEKTPELKQEAKNCVNVDFPGFIDGAEKPGYLASLDCLLHPSKIEGYGLPIVEALKSGTPVVTLRDGLIPRDVQRHTYTADGKQGLARLMEKLSRNGETGVDSEARRFASSHSWERCVEETEQIYRKIVENG